MIISLSYEERYEIISVNKLIVFLVISNININ